MRSVSLCVLLSLLAACGGNVIVDGPGGSSGDGGGGGGAMEPCPGFNRWCDLTKKCTGVSTCNANVCALTNGPKALQCVADLPDNATCEELAVCGGA